MELKEAPPEVNRTAKTSAIDEAEVYTIEEAERLLQLSGRQIRTLRNQAEELLGRSLTQSIKRAGRRYVVMSGASLQVLQAFRERRSDDEFVLRYAPERLVRPPAEDWSPVAADVDASIEPEVLDAEFADAEAGTLVPALRPQIKRREAEVDALLGMLVRAGLQAIVNGRAATEADLAQVREDAKIAYLKRVQAKIQGEQEIEEQLKRATAAAAEALDKPAKSSKRAR